MNLEGTPCYACALKAAASGAWCTSKHGASVGACPLQIQLAIKMYYDSLPLSLSVKLPLTDVDGVAYTTGTAVKSIKTNVRMKVAVDNARGTLVFVSRVNLLT
jgi:hypothetical protein